MKELLFVFIGGGTGSVFRYAISWFWKQQHWSAALPWPTLLANVAGCFLIGLFYQQSERWGLSSEVRLLLTTGLCGGFTTFSTFSYEGLNLLRGGQISAYILYALLSIGLGIAAALLPIWAIK